MREPPECLNRRYNAVDKLISELSQAMSQNTERDVPNDISKDVGIKLMCEFWNILKEDPECNLTDMVRQRMCPTKSSIMFGRDIGCYMAETSSNRNKKSNKNRSSPCNSCCDQNSNSPACNTNEPPCSSTPESTPLPLSKVLCNLKDAASLDQMCNIRVKELMMTEKQLQDQIKVLEEREKEGVQMMKHADCMWCCMEDAYKSRLQESAEKQKVLMNEMKEVEKSMTKWRKNKKDVEFQLESINKCHGEFTEKINQKNNDLKCIDIEIQDYKKRIAANKKEAEVTSKCLDQKKCASAAKLTSVAAEVTSMERAVKEELKRKRDKENEGAVYIREARDELQKLCRVLLRKKLENEDLKAEKDALILDIEMLNQTSALCKEKCSNKQKSLENDLKEVTEQIKNYELKCIKCSVCTDTNDVRKLCTDCPRCSMIRECIYEDGECHTDPDECICTSIKEKFLDNVFENMYTVLARKVKSDAGKNLGQQVLNCLKKSRNGKLDSETKNVLQHFVLNAVKRNLNLTIIGGAVKTRCEMEPETHKQLMTCINRVSVTEPLKSDKGTEKKIPCGRWGGSSECHCPKGPNECICTVKAPRLNDDAKEADPKGDDDIPATKTRKGPPLDVEDGDICPYTKEGCGPECGARSPPSLVGAEVSVSWKRDPCKGPNCSFSKNMRAAQCVLGPESLSSQKTSSKSPLPHKIATKSKGYVTRAPCLPKDMINDPLGATGTKSPKHCVCQPKAKQKKAVAGVQCDCDTSSQISDQNNDIKSTASTRVSSAVSSFGSHKTVVSFTQESGKLSNEKSMNVSNSLHTPRQSTRIRSMNDLVDIMKWEWQHRRCCRPRVRSPHNTKVSQTQGIPKEYKTKVDLVYSPYNLETPRFDGIPKAPKPNFDQSDIPREYKATQSDISPKMFPRSVDQLYSPYNFKIPKFEGIPKAYQSKLSQEKTFDQSSSAPKFEGNSSVFIASSKEFNENEPRLYSKTFTSVQCKDPNCDTKVTLKKAHKEETTGDKLKKEIYEHTEFEIKSNDYSQLSMTASGFLTMIFDEKLVETILKKTKENPDLFIYVTRTPSGNLTVNFTSIEDKSSNNHRVIVKETPSGNVTMELHKSFVDTSNIPSNIEDQQKNNSHDAKLKADNNSSSQSVDINRPKPKQNVLLKDVGSRHSGQLKNIEMPGADLKSELEKYYNQNIKALTMRFKAANGTESDIDTKIVRTLSGTIAINVNEILSLGKLNNDITDRPAILSKNRSGVFSLEMKAYNDGKLSNSVIRKAGSNRLLLFTKPMEMTESKISDVDEELNSKDYLKLKVCPQRHVVKFPSAVLHVTPSGNYTMVLDKEYERIHRTVIQDKIKDGSECCVSLRNTDSGNYVMDFEQNYYESESQCARLTKDADGNIKVLIRCPDYPCTEKRSSQGTQMPCSMKAAEPFINLLNRLPTKCSKACSTISTPHKATSKYASDSNLYEKTRLRIQNDSQILGLWPSAALEPSDGGRLNVVLNKESKKALIKNLKSFVKSGSNVVPVSKTSSGLIVINLNDGERSQDHYGALSITPSGNIYITAAEPSTCDCPSTSEENGESEIIMSKNLSPSDKECCTTCNGQPNRDCDTSKCICSDMKCLNDSSMNEYRYDGKMSSPGGYSVGGKKKGKRNSSSNNGNYHNRKKHYNKGDKRNNSMTIERCECVTLPKIGSSKEEQCYYLLKPFNNFKAKSSPVAVETIDDTIKTKDSRNHDIVPGDGNWDSLKFLPPQLPSFLQGVNYV